MILTAVLILVLGHLIVGAIVSFQVRKLYFYPGVLGYPVIGSIFYFYRNLFIGSIEGLRNVFAQIVKEHGEKGICFHYIYNFNKLALISSPEIIKQLAFHPNLKDKPHYMFHGFHQYLNGPFTRPPTDDQWKLMRKEYNSSLKRLNIENIFHDIFLKSADKLVELMLDLSFGLDIAKTSCSVVLSATLETLFDVKGSLAYNPEFIYEMFILKRYGSLWIGNPKLTNIVTSIIRPIDELYFRKFGTLRRTVLRKIYKDMNNSNGSKNTDSYEPIVMLIASRIEKNKQFESKLTKESQELLIAASHTVSSELTAAISILAVHPEIQEKAWKEQYDIFGDDTREPTKQDLQQMTYLERFIKETLRFGGPPFIAKQATADVEVDGMIIPKDTVVTYLLDYIMHDPKYWEDPEIFEPDRFLEENEGLKHICAPFGVGIRSCPGSTFAIVLLKILLSKLLRKTKFSPVKKDLKFKDLVFKGNILMELTNPPLLQVEERV